MVSKESGHHSQQAECVVRKIAPRHYQAPIAKASWKVAVMGLSQPPSQHQCRKDFGAKNVRIRANA